MTQPVVDQGQNSRLKKTTNILASLMPHKKTILFRKSGSKGQLLGENKTYVKMLWRLVVKF
jgi:hypothetical protein